MVHYLHMQKIFIQKVWCNYFMKKYTVELDTCELVKLISICNTAIVTEEEILRNLEKSSNLTNIHNKKVIENTKNSIEFIWNLKTKIKNIINDAYKNTINDGGENNS